MKSKSETRKYSQVARAAAADDTAKRIIDAFLGRLLTDWFDEITLDRIAADAGVTVQTVIRRFGGKDGLLASAVKIMAEQINAQRATPPGDVHRLVTNLMKDYERTGDAVIRLLALEPRHPALKEVLDIGRGEHRQWVATGFADQLNQISTASEREKTLDALVTVTDVYTWKLLRRDMNRSRAATAATMRRLIEGLFADSLPTDSQGAGA